MNYKKIFKISNVWFTPFIIEYMVFFVEYPSKRISLFNNNKITNFEGLEFYSINKWNNYFITDNLIFFNYIKFKIDNKINLLNLFNSDLELSLSLIVNNESIIVKKIDEKLGKVWYYLVNLFQNSQIQLEILNPRLITNSYIISSKTQFLLAYNLTDATELWHIDVSEIGSYTDIGEQRSGSINYEILTYNDLVIFSSGPHVFAANCHTGQMVWHTTLQYNQARIVLFNDILYIKSGYHFYQLEAATGKVLIEYDFQKNWPANYEVGRWLSWHHVYDDCMAVTDCMALKILILNKNNFDIMEVIEIKGAKNEIPVANAPQIHGNRLYQLDGDNTLHIFEKE